MQVHVVVECPHIIGAQNPRPTLQEFVRGLTEEEKRELRALLIADQPQQERTQEVNPQELRMQEKQCSSSKQSESILAASDTSFEVDDVNAIVNYLN